MSTTEERLAALEAQFAELSEEVEDLLAARKMAQLLAHRAANPDEPTFPGAVVAATVNGDSLMRAWRKYRGMTLKELSTQTGIAHGHLSQIETGKSYGQLPAWRKIAAALGVTMGQLLDEPDSEAAAAE